MRKRRNIFGVIPLMDLILITGLFMFGFWLRHSLLAELMGTDFRLSAYHYLLSGVVLGSVQVIFMVVFGVYRREFGLGMIEEIAGIIKASLMAVLFTFATTFITRQLFFSRFVLVFTFPVSVILLSIMHSLARKHAARSGPPFRVFIIGISSDARQLGSFMETRAQLAYSVIEYADPSINTDELILKIEKSGADQLLVADRSIAAESLLRVIQHCEKQGIQYKIAADAYSLISLTARVAHMGGTTLIETVPAPLAGWGLVFKRASDIIITTILLTLLAPLFLAISAAILLETGKPVFYLQKRLGKNNVPFMMFKFRSMVKNAHSAKKQLLDNNEATGPLFKIKNDPRITAAGKFLRRWSLDELPQLINVLKGEMSLVGPRPPLPEEVEEYSRRDYKRLQTIPGVTGIWQISGRSNLGFDEMVKMDLYYVDNWSIWMDLAILMLTLPAIISGDGAY
ncbi:hypothetical protein CSA37_01825 [Candidatus Fermentibacteria bacterium]|nr:MAG: hypothetical protein CSA37_01825 [Candidatus Fermentibacteria bacterium]